MTTLMFNPMKLGHPMGIEHMQAAPRCGARNRQGKPCKKAAMRGRCRCRLHGGVVGRKTPEGIERSRLAHLKHGRCCRDTVLLMRSLREHSRTQARTRALAEDGVVSAEAMRAEAEAQEAVMAMMDIVKAHAAARRAARKTGN